MNFVLDASVALKWYYQESDSGQAKLIYKQIQEGDHFVMIPFLAFIEVANALIFHKLPIYDLEDILSNLHSIPSDYVPYNQSLLQRAIKNATEYSLSIYDAIYLSLAKTAGIKLLTADKKIIKAAPKDCVTIENLI